VWYRISGQTGEPRRHHTHVGHRYTACCESGTAWMLLLLLLLLLLLRGAA